MHFPLFSAALQNRLTAGLCHCNHTYVDLRFIQVWIEPTDIHCSTGQGKMHFPLFSAALQNRLTAGLCHCNHTYGELLFIQVWTEPTDIHSSTGLGKMYFPLFSAALQNRLTAGLEDWLQNVNLPRSSWGSVAAGSSSDTDKKQYNDHIRHVKEDTSELS